MQLLMAGDGVLHTVLGTRSLLKLFWYFCCHTKAHFPLATGAVYKTCMVDGHL